MNRREAIETALDEIGHVDRLYVLEACAAGPASAKTICVVTGSTLGTTAYHVRALHDRKLIKHHRTTQVRGALQRFYVISAPGRRLLDSLGLDDG